VVAARFLRGCAAREEERDEKKSGPAHALASAALAMNAQARSFSRHFENPSVI
jgi:hypothetical protein